MSALESLHIKNGAAMGTRNGVSVPLNYNQPEAERVAMRKTILLTDYSHLGMAEISGEGAYELLNLMVAGDVGSIRDEQGMYTIILNNEGEIISDVYILCDDERFIVMSEWLTGDAISEMMKHLLEQHGSEFEEIGHIGSLGDSLGVLHFEGPYSWELLAEMYGMDVLGLPFQEHMHVGDDEILFRAGEHGEYSYKLIANNDRLEAIWEQAVQAGEKYDMAVGGLDYQRDVRLENPCWEPDVFNEFSRCPIQLQMQWTVRYDKDQFKGKDALNSVLGRGVERRAVGFSIEGAAPADVARGDKVYVGESEIGVVITCGYSKDIGATVGRLLLDAAYAYADLDQYEVQTCSGRLNLKTTAVPIYRNFSFLINPSEHSYVDSSRPKHLLEQLEWQAAAKAKAEKELADKELADKELAEAQQAEAQRVQA
ncbi:glycine cleavage T C-terminal barrel domain-containing protein [Paraburkholderia sp.]|uniref:glycine cleavage T C-terminal barrel domain-containing protein n=1 Tax=Paraburkholderia sp. TaxID=1926495 RepID=UPI0025F2C72F|nr:glycine cleavage T C-terminal barrel domain-containing protein [Paraburkholderia sp.]